jgi:hypothetical protein
MKYLSNILYFDTNDMMEIGVKKRTIEQSNWRGSNTYTTIKDPSDQRRILVEYDSLRPELKLRAQKWLGECPHSWYAKNWICSYVQPDAKAWDFMRRYQVSSRFRSLSEAEVSEAEVSGTETTGRLPQDDQEAYYTACQWLNMIDKVSNNRHILKQHNCTKAEFWQIVGQLIRSKGIRLPADYSRLTQKLRRYRKEGCRAVIKEGNYGNDNGQIINDEVADWLVAQYALPVKHDVSYLHQYYNSISEARGWKPIKDENTIFKFLDDPEIKQLWWGPRHGERKALEKYGYSLRTRHPRLRDALWYADATKLNFFDSTGKLRASFMVYEIMDVATETFLGYHIAPTEDHEMQYHAFKMAIKTAGQKPYELRTDNQGGHKKIQHFLDRIARLNIRTQAYNGKSKTIENAFYRFQRQYMARHWYFTGQNITAKKENSRANMEFVISNLKHLPTQQEIKQAYAECREQWNNARHPRHDQSRIALYRASENPKATPVDYLDMVELFWLQAAKPITYYNSGISITVGGVTHEYEVLKDGMPDKDFMAAHIGRKFIVKYDPDNMDHLRLYNENGAFINIAEPRLVVPRATQDYQPGDRVLISELLAVRKDQDKRMKANAKARAERTGIRPEDLVNKNGLSQVKIEKAEPVATNNLAQWQKELSNADPCSEQNLYKLI